MFVCCYPMAKTSCVCTSVFANIAKIDDIKVLI